MLELSEVVCEDLASSENKSKNSFFKPPFGALSKIGDQIRKYVVKDHGFPFIKLEGTGAYGPLLLAPVEGFGSPLGPLTCGGNLF